MSVQLTSYVSHTSSFYLWLQVVVVVISFIFLDEAKTLPVPIQTLYAPQKKYSFIKNFQLKSTGKYFLLS